MYGKIDVKKLQIETLKSSLRILKRIFFLVGKELNKIFRGGIFVGSLDISWLDFAKKKRSNRNNSSWFSQFSDLPGTPKDMGPLMGITPVSKWLVTPIYKPFRPFVRGTTLLRGLTNHGY